MSHAKHVINALLAVAIGCGAYALLKLVGYADDYATIAALIIALYPSRSAV